MGRHDTLTGAVADAMDVERPTGATPEENQAAAIAAATVMSEPANKALLGPVNEDYLLASAIPAKNADAVRVIVAKAVKSTLDQ